MAFCVNCGTKIEEGVKFCSGCGTPVGSAGVEIKQEKAVNFIQTQTSALPASGVYQAQNTQITADEKYCFSCGAVIKKAAVICTKCGVNQSMRSSTTAIDVYCTSCGKSIKKEAAVCPFCGVEQEKTATKNKTTALLLCLFTAVGHRFYVGKIGTAILMLLVYIIFFCLCGFVAETEDEVAGVFLLLFLLGYLIWWIIDLVSIGTGKFTDKQGNLLKKN